MLKFLVEEIRTSISIVSDILSFDGIIVLDLLKQADAYLCLASDHLKWGIEVEKICFHENSEVNLK